MSFYRSFYHRFAVRVIAVEWCEILTGALFPSQLMARNKYGSTMRFSTINLLAKYAYDRAVVI